MDALIFDRSPAAPVGQTVGAAPWVYVNASADIQQVTITGGVVALIEVNTGLGYLPFPALFGVVTLFPGQSVRTTYVVTPPVVSMVQL